MKKNVVIIQALLEPNKELPHYAVRDIQYWDYYCKKNNIEFIVTTDKIHDFSEMIPAFQKFYTYEILEKNGIDFDQCLLADWDTFPMPNAKNLFDYTNDKFTICLDYGYAPALMKRTEFVGNYFDNSKVVTWDNYFNSGFFIFQKGQKFIFEKAIEFFNKYKEDIMVNKKLAIDEQTIFNYIVHGSVETTILPRSFMVHDYFLRIFLNNYTDHENKFMDAQSYMPNNVNYVHMTADTEFRNQVVEIAFNRFYKDLL